MKLLNYLPLIYGYLVAFSSLIDEDYKHFKVVWQRTQYQTISI